MDQTRAKGMAIEGRQTTTVRLTLAMAGGAIALYFTVGAWLTGVTNAHPFQGESPHLIALLSVHVLVLPILVGLEALVAFLVRDAERPRLSMWVTRVWTWTGRIFLAVFVALGVVIVAAALGSSGGVVQGQQIWGATAAGYVLYYPVVVALAVACLPGGTAPYFVTSALLLTFPASLIEQADPYGAAQQAIFFSIFNLVQLYPMGWVLNRAGRLDRLQASNAKSNAALAAEKGVTVATRRTEDFVHDEVLSTLLVVSRGELSIDATKELLAQLRGKLTQQVAPKPPVNWQGIFAQLQEETRQWAGAVAVVGTVEKNHPIPGGVSGALLSAIREAVRNSLAHAGAPGREVQREVRVEGTDRCLRIEVWDNGIGLPTGATEGRHGMKNSILRCAQDAGVRVSVSAVPGCGTQVVFELGTDEELPEPFEMVMGSAWVRVIIAAMVGYNALATVLHWHSYSLPWSSLAGGVMMSVAAVLLLAPQEPRARAVATNATIVALILASTAVQSFTTLSATPAYWAHWASSVGALILCWVLALEMTALAWLGMGGIVSIWAAATIFHGFSWGGFVTFMSGHVFLLLIWQVLVMWADHSARRIALEDHYRAELAYWMQVEEVLQEHMVRTRKRLRSRLIPLVDTISASDETTLPVRVEAALLEAELRDELRAACFTGTQVASHARRLRAGGVEVVLLDDSGGRLPQEQRDPLALLVAASLEGVNERSGSSRVVVRVLPPSRAALAQVVVDGEQILSIPRTAGI